MSHGSSAAWKKWSDQRHWCRGQWEPLDSWRGNDRWSGNDTPGRSPGDKDGDDEWSWKLVKKRKTKGKVVATAAASVKDPQAVTDTKAKRTFLEVILGDDSGLGKKKEKRDAGNGKHDLEKATKPQSKAKSNIAGIQEKASFIEREETRLAELEIAGKRTSSALENEGRPASKHGHEQKTGHRCEY